jgi:hypothetical protein
VNATGTLRVSEEGEVYGLDLHEHGISAYPEYVISALGRPAGMHSESILDAPTFVSKAPESAKGATS